MSSLISVSAYAFYTFIEDIKRFMHKNAPEWELKYNRLYHEKGERGYYHLSRFNWSEGKQKKWPFKISQQIFAYEDFEDPLNPTYWLMGFCPFIGMNPEEIPSIKILATPK